MLSKLSKQRCRARWGSATKNILVSLAERRAINQIPAEMVERKGIGHPDTICDAASEEVSRALSRYYLENYGRIYHHNVDKAVLVGGRVQVGFGGGRLLEPIYLLIVGRATTEMMGEQRLERAPVGSLALESTYNWIQEHMRFLDPDKHLVIDSKIKSGSADLVTVFENERIPLANDTSFGTAFAPLTETEQLVLETEQFLNDKKIAPREIGEDIKVMGSRMEDEIQLTIAAAMIASLIPDKDHYRSVQEEVCNRVADLAIKLTEKNVTVDINTGDNPEKDSYYLTVTGTSAEHGDDGQVGRGNRTTGLITPYRPQSLEAACGKNPINHTGKLLNIAAKIIAERIEAEIHPVEANVYLLSQIGKPITEPQLANVELILANGKWFNVVKNEVEAIIDEELEKLPGLWENILKDYYTLF